MVPDDLTVLTHAPEELEPAGDVKPLAHEVQTVSPDTAEKVPAGHGSTAPPVCNVYVYVTVTGWPEPYVDAEATTRHNWTEVPDTVGENV